MSRGRAATAAASAASPDTWIEPGGGLFNIEDLLAGTVRAAAIAGCARCAGPAARRCRHDATSCAPRPARVKDTGSRRDGVRFRARAVLHGPLRAWYPDGKLAAE
jgi:hypothetical protein